MICDIHRHVANLLLTTTGHDPVEVRRDAAREAAAPAMGEIYGDARRDLSAADTIATALTPHLLAFRELVEAAEAAGWDVGDNKDLLDRARASHAALTGFDNTRAGS
jgi:hypothetical protein